MPYERPLIQECIQRKPSAAREYRKASVLSLLSHAITTKFGVEVETDNPVRLAAELVNFCLSWRKAHGTGPLDSLRIKAIEGKVRIYRETTDPSDTPTEEF